MFSMSSLTSTHRVERLATQLQEDGIDVFFANHPITTGYLHGFWEGSHERFMTLAIRSTGEVRLICPALSETQARKSGIADVQGWQDGTDPMALFDKLAHDWNLKSGILAVDDEMPAQMLLKMQDVLPAALFKAGQPTLSKLMRRKDANEIRLMREAAGIADRSISSGLEAIRPGVSERDVERAINNAMEALGGKPTFCIVATGANTAEPHHLTDGTLIKEGDVVLMDFGCSVDGYQSDITRAACCGTATDEAKKVYKIVLDSHNAGRAVARAGATSSEVDGASRKVIEDAGYGEYFIHRTGHGIGLRGHEEPYIVSGDSTALEVGDCFSVEPGIYLPGKFGIRIENIVTIGEKGGYSLDEDPATELMELS